MKRVKDEVWYHLHIKETQRGHNWYYSVSFSPECGFQCGVFVCSVPDILFYFISAGGGLRMEVKEYNPRVESKSHRG